MVRAFIVSTAIALLLAGCIRPVVRPRAEGVERFAQEIEQLREEFHIPGLSVAILEDQRVIYAHGFGLADVENGVPATEKTPYEIASLTKPFTAVLLMQLVESGRLDLHAEMADVLADTTFVFPALNNAPLKGYDELCAAFTRVSRTQSGLSPVMAYFLDDYRCSSEPIAVVHHLSHTAQGAPGEMYRYNSLLFNMLGQVAESATGQEFGELLATRIVGPLGMSDTLPNTRADRRQEVLAATAKPYFVDAAGNLAPSDYEVDGVAGAAAGMVSTVLDLAKFDTALDRNRLISPESRETMFSPAVASSGEELPYGLGWFVQEHDGVKLIWHHGYQPGAYSSLFLKVPQQELTLILLANSDGASASFNLHGGDVLASPFAASFLKLVAGLDATGGGS